MHLALCPVPCGPLQVDEAAHQAAQIEAAKQHRVQWEADVQEKGRLAKMGAQEEAFRASVMARRHQEFQALKVQLPLPPPPPRRTGIMLYDRLR